MFPTHWFNSAALLVSLLCFLTWIFLSPPHTDEAASLDRKLGSYYGVQFLASLFVTATHMTNCTASPLLALLLFCGGLLGSVVVSVMVTNLLCHRYLMERENAMNGASMHMYGGRSSFFNIEAMFKGLS
jgi:hypothetical protein